MNYFNLKKVSIINPRLDSKGIHSDIRRCIFFRMRTILFIYLFNCLICSPVFASQAQSDTIKSIFIYRMTNYIHWPKKYDEQVFKILVYNDPGLFQALKTILDGKTIKGKNIDLREGNDLNEATTAKIVIAGGESREEIIPILEKVKDHPVVFICQLGGMLKEGATINFYESRGRLAFEVNEDATKKNGITIHSYLLELSRSQR